MFGCYPRLWKYDLRGCDDVDLKIRVSLTVSKKHTPGNGYKYNRNTYNNLKCYAIDANRLLIELRLKLMEVVKGCLGCGRGEGYAKMG